MAATVTIQIYILKKNKKTSFWSWRSLAAAQNGPGFDDGSAARSFLKNRPLAAKKTILSRE
jgi:hypothetical protein